MVEKVVLKESKPNLRKCSCGNYTMKETCDKCGKTTFNAGTKYSPEDKYGKQRRKAMYGV